MFRADSLLGVPGLMDIYKKGRVALANAPGTGIADDKSIYAYVPKIIEYYLGEKIVIPNVPTYICAEPKELSYVRRKSRQISGQGRQRIGRLRHAGRSARHGP